MCSNALLSFFEISCQTNCNLTLSDNTENILNTETRAME